MTKFNVHIYREMRVKFDGIEAETPEVAAAIAHDKPSEDADDIEDCNGEDLAALVDVAGDEDCSQSVTIDFEAERQRKAAPKLLSACRMVVGRWEHGDLAEAARTCQDAIAEAETAGIPSEPAGSAPRLRQTLEDVAEWLETGMIDGVHFDEAVILDSIRQTLATAKQPSPDGVDVHTLLAKRRQIADIWSTLDVKAVWPVTDEQAWAVLERVRRFYDASVGINWDVLTCHAAAVMGDAPETGAAEEE